MTAKIINFNTYKINTIVKSLCERHHYSSDYFYPLVNELLRRNENISMKDIEEEIEFFMIMKNFQERLY